MSIINNFGGGYNVQEQPVEYYETSNLKNLKNNSTNRLSFDKK